MKYTFLDREVELSDQEILSIIWKGGKFRRTKPKIKFEVVGRYKENDLKDGIIAYVWRMIGFYTQSERPYCCMPVCAQFDLPGGFSSNCDREVVREAEKLLRKQCDDTADHILELIPKSQWKGVMTWGRALGVL